jgi:hypothetical protein
MTRRRLWRVEERGRSSAWRAAEGQAIGREPASQSCACVRPTVGCREALSLLSGRPCRGLRKAIVHGLKQRERLSAPILTVPQARKARGCAQLPRQGALSARGVERLPEVILGHRRRPRMLPAPSEALLCGAVTLGLSTIPRHAPGIPSSQPAHRARRQFLLHTPRPPPAHPPMWLTAGRNRTRAPQSRPMRSNRNPVETSPCFMLSKPWWLRP